jgi:CheY-like chemotaxis protein
MAKILIVDDENLIRAILREQLHAQDHTVIEAGDGDEALETARREKPDLILLDMSLPGMTGFELAPILSADPDTRHVPILALTGHTSEADRDAAHFAGCDRYLAKPIDAARLFAAIDDLLG